MIDDPLTRRRTLGLAGSALAAGFAGCVTEGTEQLTNDPGSDGPDGSTAQDDSTDGDHDHDVDHELGHPEERVEVRMETDDEGHHFVPHAVHVEPGGTVTWILDSGVHDTVAYHPENASLLPSAVTQRIPDGVEPWASDVYDAEGETFDLTFEQEGVYDYACTISGHGHRSTDDDGYHGHHGGHHTHESAGMVGRVIVGDPDLDPDEQPAMRSPSTELPETARHELEEFNDRTRDALETGDGH